jgi:O-antigen biosynthesis protein
MQVMVILGMHRSGTSAVARVCNLLGADIGRCLLPAKEDNTAGFWELEEIVKVHDELLASLGLSWHTTETLPANWWEDPKVSAFKVRLIDVLRREFGNAEFVCLKDPRMSRLVPLWRSIFDEMSWTPHYLLTLRNPLEVAQSLSARHGFHVCKSHLLWLRHVLEAERWTRGQQRAYVSYEQLMANWRAAMTPAWRQLGFGALEIDAPTAGRIDDFLQGDLRHHARKREELENDTSHALIRRVYDDYASVVTHDTSRAAAALSELEQSLTETSYLFEPIIADEHGQKTVLAAELHSVNLRFNAASGEINQLKHQLAAASQLAMSRLAQIDHLNDVIAERDNAIRDQAGTINAMLNSTSWRLTAPVRMIKTGGRSARDGLRAMTVSGLRWLFTQLPTDKSSNARLKVFAATLAGLVHRLEDGGRSYRDWIARYDRLDDTDLEGIRRHMDTLARQPLISVVMPVFDTPERFLRRAIDSILAQIYPHWELCIADDCSTQPYVSRVIREYVQRDQRIKAVFRTRNGNISACSNSALALAKGEFVALVDHDDLLAAHALYMVAAAVNDHPQADVIFSDEDKVDQWDRRSQPYFKPDWNPDLFLAQNMINHLGVYRTSIVRAVSGFREGFEGSQDYDLALRVIERSAPDGVVHIPHVLYHWRMGPALRTFSQGQLPRAVHAAQRAVREHLARTGMHATVRAAPGAGHYQRLSWPVPAPAPLVSIIIPTRDQAGLLRKCMQGLLSDTRYTPFEVIVVDNGSIEPQSHAYLGEIQNDARVRVLHYDREFNYSAINNFAIQQARGELICLLNNDIVVINEDWLDEMVSHAVRPEVGAVGAMLYYPTNTIQHAGIILGIGGVAGHSHKHFLRGDVGYFGRLKLAHDVSAVTGACLVARREVLDACGGLDEKNLRIGFNDVDLCLRICARGYRIVWTPHAELYHLESASRGSDVAPDKAERFRKEVIWMKSRWGDTLLHDPCYSPNLTLDREDFSLAYPPRGHKAWNKPVTEMMSSGERDHAAALEGQ